ncbi:MAG: hypothetical protein FWE67_04025 [Planctomycetaceae bacterium]|nr:hypothetical protein [Planctomycetaceae bacterium]
MSEQQKPLTCECVLEMFRESELRFNRMMKKNAREMKRMAQEADRRQEEADRRKQALDKQMKRTDKKISELGSRIGKIVENMVAGNIIEKFQALNYDVTGCSPHKSFAVKKLGISGEIDLLLDDGEVAILIEVKTTLETADVRKHIERIEKYRRYADARGIGKTQRYIGAVAGAVIMGEAAQFAHENGMYVIVQSGKAVNIVPPPEGFTAKEW